ncbi:MAG: hypothetical protein IKO51_10180, partial [Clostridia bacterium]|nr:hypothetical protein [Clostridia bacterium]
EQGDAMIFYEIKKSSRTKRSPRRHGADNENESPAKGWQRTGEPSVTFCGKEERRSKVMR